MSKATGFSKIQNHPDKDEIVEKLIAGVAVRKIDSWLKQKYPHNKKLHVSYMSLQSYRKNYLNIEGTVIKDLQQKRKDLQQAKRLEQQQEEVKSSVVYQQGLNSFVQDSLLDYNAEILKMMEEINDGIDNLKELNQQKSSHLNHQALASYLEKYKAVIEMHHKMVQAQEKKAGDQLEQDYEVLTKKIEVLTDAVKQAFNETNPEGLPVFLQIVKEKMNEAGLQ